MFISAWTGKREKSAIISVHELKKRIGSEKRKALLKNHRFYSMINAVNEVF